jgi:hypothetical protein
MVIGLKIGNTITIRIEYPLSGGIFNACIIYFDNHTHIDAHTFSCENSSGI